MEAILWGPINFFYVSKMRSLEFSKKNFVDFTDLSCICVPINKMERFLSLRKPYEQIVYAISFLMLATA